MDLKKTLAATTAVALSFSVVACSSDSSSGSSSSGDLITAGGGLTEPQNPLIPANTNEVGGGTIIDNIFSGLVSYDGEGKIHNEMAQSIDLEGDRTYKVTLKDGIQFSDGSPIKSENFVRAWNLAVEKSMLSAYFFEPIKGYARPV